MKKILAIVGSPRASKNSNDLVDILLDNVDRNKYKIEKIYLSKLEINHCTGCNYCGRTGECIFKDGMEKIYEGFDNSDIVILSAPVYFNSVNGLTKNMIDRTQKYWSQKYILGENYKRGEDRKGIFLSPGGAKFTQYQFDGMIPVIDFFFKAINVDYNCNYFVSGTDNIKIKDRLDVIEDLKYIGENIESIENLNIHK